MEFTPGIEETVVLENHVKLGTASRHENSGNAASYKGALSLVIWTTKYILCWVCEMAILH